MVQVNGMKQLLKHPMDHVSQQTSDSTCLVHLRLQPVGARISFQSSQQLCNVVNSLLATLAPVHAAGFVHHDIRLDNIIKGPKGWVLLGLLEDNIKLVDWADFATCSHV